MFSGSGLNFSGPSSITPNYGSMNPNTANILGGAAGGILGGLFNDSGAPYEDAMKQYEKYFGQAEEKQQPFYQAGVNAIPEYQQWLQGQKNPSEFINNLMNNYQESPYAQNLQRQSRLAGTNAASAGGLIGSTPFAQQMQQNAANISSQDMNQWLQNVLGINRQYGAGTGALMQGGQSSANALTELLARLGASMGEQAYNQGAAENNDFSNLMGGLGSLAMMFL